MTTTRRLRLYGIDKCLYAQRTFSSFACRAAAPSRTHLARMPGDQENTEARPASTPRPTKRSPSPSQRPKTETPQESVYILTFQTDQEHHKRMTALRNKYFPPKLNKLAAHLTLFHALPESRLDNSIIPVIEKVAAETFSFDIHAHEPFKLKRGVALSCGDKASGLKAQDIRGALQRPWLEEGFLSEQDSGKKIRLHYTLMNKVNDPEEVDRAFRELREQFFGDKGRIKGLDLYRYERGRWVYCQTFPFRSREAEAARNLYYASRAQVS